jgi:hypothetical protein
MDNVQKTNNGLTIFLCLFNYLVYSILLYKLTHLDLSIGQG